MKKFLNKLVIIFSIIFCWNIFLFTFSFATATTSTPARNSTTTSNMQNNAKKTKETKTKKQQNLSEDVEWMQKLWQALYTITWPLLLIWWAFMTNDVIYGSFIWMDVLLWKVWNVMRTFANYIIWFILIFSIFALFLWWKFEQLNPVKIIPQLAIAAVLVNASWFLIWIMVDISNVMTYAVGTLPLKIADKKLVNDISMPNFSLKLQNQSKDAFQVWIMDGKKLLPFCEYKPLENWKLQAKTDCVFQSKWKYYKYSAWEIIDIENISSKTPMTFKHTFWEIQKKLWWMTWVLWTMYASLIDIWSSVSYPSWSWTAMIWDVIFKFILLFALLIPLFTLAIILIVRAVFLWMFIVISPLVFLFTPIKHFEKVLWEKWKLTNLVSLIFLPVVVVFALSLSFVFLSYLKFYRWAIKDTFWLKFDWKQIVVPLDWKDWTHNVTISYKWNDSASFFSNLWNFFEWLVENIFAIAFMWIIVFAAFKTSKLTSWISSSINRFSINMAKSTPFIPIAGWQSISSLWQWMSQLQNLPSQWQQEQYADKIQPMIEELQNKMTWAESNAIKGANETISTTSIAGGTSVQNYDAVINSTKSSSFGTKTIWWLLKNTDKLNELAWELKISTDKLRKILEKQNKSNTLWSILSNIKTDLEKAFADGSKEELKKLIKDKVLDKNIITLLQLDDVAKWKLIALFKQVWIKGVSDIWRNEVFVKALKQLWFTKDEIIKLLSDNLDGSKATMKNADKLQIDSRYNWSSTSTP